MAAAAMAAAGPLVHRGFVATGGFRFEGLTDVWAPGFVPGGAKYGDVPALLSLCAPVPLTVHGEPAATLPGPVQTFAVAGGRLEFSAAGLGEIAAALDAAEAPAASVPTAP
jgi:hypothetical protein